MVRITAMPPGNNTLKNVYSFANLLLNFNAFLSHSLFLIKITDKNLFVYIN